MKKTSKGTTFAKTRLEAKTMKGKLEGMGYTNVKVSVAPQKIQDIVKQKYEITYTIHW